MALNASIHVLVACNNLWPGEPTLPCNINAFHSLIVLGFIVFGYPRFTYTVSWMKQLLVCRQHQQSHDTLHIDGQTARDTGTFPVHHLGLCTPHNGHHPQCFQYLLDTPLQKEHDLYNEAGPYKSSGGSFLPRVPIFHFPIWHWQEWFIYTI